MLVGPFKKAEGIRCYLIILRGPRVEGPTEEELGYHTAQGPHVNGLTERQAQDDLWSSANRGGKVVWLCISGIFSSKNKIYTAEHEKKLRKSSPVTICNAKAA